MARKTSSTLERNTKRKTPKGVVDAYFRNVRRNKKSGELEPTSCGIVNFKPGEVRFVSAQAQVRSGNAFTNGVRLGWLRGPAESEAELEFDLDLEENPDTVDRGPELPREDADVASGPADPPSVEPVGPPTSDPAPADPPPSVESPPPAEAPVSIENIAGLSQEDYAKAKAELIEVGKKEAAAADSTPAPVAAAPDEVTEPKRKAPSAKDLIAGSKPKKKSSKKK